MYATQEARDTDIDAWGQRAAEALLADLEIDERGRPRRPAAARAGARRHAAERTPGGRTFRAAAFPYMRLREVVYHHVDLDAGFAFVDVEPELLAMFLDREVTQLARNPGAPSVRLVSDEGDSYDVGDEPTTTVTGSRAGLVLWLARADAGRCRGHPEPAGAAPWRLRTARWSGRRPLHGPGDPRRSQRCPRAVRARIRKASVSEMDNNAYLLTCRATGAQLLIDAADDAARCLALVAEGTGRLDHIVTTHQHWDHVRALAEVVAATGARTYAGADDADALPVPPDVRLRARRHGDLRRGRPRRHPPARPHAGSVALAYRDPGGPHHLFTGDSLFPGGVGNTTRPGQSFDSLIEDVTTRVFDVYDDGTWFYPGHGADSTLGAERPHLPEWRARGW